MTHLKRKAEGVFELRTSRGDYLAEQVVIASGTYHAPKVPRMAERLSPHIKQLHTSELSEGESTRTVEQIVQPPNVATV